MTAVRDGTPLSGEGPGGRSLPALFDGWERYQQIALAVSGGADSIALMRLAHEWRPSETAAPRARLTVLTVNHGLREEAAAEAEWVRAEAARLGLPHHTLVWQGTKPASGIQAAARHARYALMAGFCRENAVSALAVAHTRDDQAETLLMRLARGSGVDGLAGMATVSRMHGIDVLRPLLDVSRAELETWLNSRRQDWLNDPSNQNTHYERVRVRRALGQGGAAALGLTADKLALSAMRLRRARDALETAAAAFLRDEVRIHDAGYCEFQISALARQPEDVALRGLARAVEVTGGGHLPVRLARLEALWGALRAGASDATLAGCAFAVRRGAVVITREYGRMDKTARALRPGEVVVWDGRFSVALADDCPPGLMLRALGADGIAALKAAKGSFGTVPRGAALALPSLWEEGRVVFAPCVTWQGQPSPGWVDNCRVKCLLSETFGNPR